jgi:hypothetical protein
VRREASIPSRGGDGMQTLSRTVLEIGGLGPAIVAVVFTWWLREYGRRKQLAEVRAGFFGELATSPVARLASF